MVEGGSDGEAEDVICVVFGAGHRRLQGFRVQGICPSPLPHEGVRLSAVSNEKLTIAAGWFKIGDRSLDTE